MKESVCVHTRKEERGCVRTYAQMCIVPKQHHNTRTYMYQYMHTDICMNDICTNTYVYACVNAYIYTCILYTYHAHIMYYDIRIYTCIDKQICINMYMM